jgi:hypothetical protein
MMLGMAVLVIVISIETRTITSSSAAVTNARSRTPPARSVVAGVSSADASALPSIEVGR